MGIRIRLPEFFSLHPFPFSLIASDERSPIMILVTRLNKTSQFYVNEKLIEFIEETPDTIVTLSTGKKITVSESAIEVVEKIREEKIRIRRATAF